MVQKNNLLGNQTTLVNLYDLNSLKRTHESHLSGIGTLVMLIFLIHSQELIQKNHLIGNQTTLVVLFVSDNHLVTLYGFDSLKTNGS